MTNVIETLLPWQLHILRPHAPNWVWGERVYYITWHRYCKAIKLPICCRASPDNKISGVLVHQIQFTQKFYCCPEAHSSDKQVCEKSSAKTGC